MQLGLMLDVSISTMLEAVKAMLCDGFYFSFGYDLTASRQRRLTWMQKKESNPIRMIASDERYFWNNALYSDFYR